MRLISPVVRSFSSFIEISPSLADLLTLKTNPSPEDLFLNIRLVSELTESNVCSFKTTMSEEQFLSVWGTSHRWDELDQEFGIHETRGKFALLYWGAVRDVAVRSPTACKSIFQLPMSIIERLASSSTMELIEFCFSDFNLQRFRLTFPEADCWAIWTALTSKTVPVIQRLRLAHAKFAKTMHAQSEGLPTGYLDTIKEDLL